MAFSYGNSILVHALICALLACFACYRLLAHFSASSFLATYVIGRFLARSTRFDLFCILLAYAAPVLLVSYFRSVVITTTSIFSVELTLKYELRGEKTKDLRNTFTWHSKSAKRIDRPDTLAMLIGFAISASNEAISE